MDCVSESEYANCLMDPLSDWENIPWLAEIEYRVGNLPAKKDLISIIGPYTLVTGNSDKSRLFRSTTTELRILPLQNYTVIIRPNSDSATQRLEVSAIKFHPDLSKTQMYWTVSQNDIVLIFLKNAITFSKYVRPICNPKWENTQEMEQTLSGIKKVFMSGRDTKQHFSSFYIQVFSKEYCYKRWRELVNPSPNAVYTNKICGHPLVRNNKTHEGNPI